MARESVLVGAVLMLVSSTVWAQAKPKIKPDINASKEFKNVYHSPSADETPRAFRSVVQMEVVVRDADTDEGQIQYVNGTVISRDGLIASVVRKPTADQTEGGIDSAAVLLLDGQSAGAELVTYEPGYGLAIFKVNGLDLPALSLSRSALVANRRVSWHAVFRNGQRTFLYTRPLKIHKARFEMDGTADLCQIIDPGSSSLNADRTGSPLLALDGSVVALMGLHEHWNVTPKNTAPRLKLAWGVPAHVISEVLEGLESQ